MSRINLLSCLTISPVKYEKNLCFFLQELSSQVPRTNSLKLTNKKEVTKVEYALEFLHFREL